MGTQKISNHLSTKLTHLNAFLTFLIVVMHYSASFRQYLPVGSAFDYAYFWFAQVLSRLAVPCFFVISGLLAFWKIEKPMDFKPMIKKRLFSLGVPYLLWNSIGLVFLVLPLLVKSHFTDFSQLNPASVVMGFYRSEYVGPLWYIRNLLVFTCLAPLVYWCLRRKLTAVLLFILSIVIIFIPGCSVLDLFTGLFFYVLGAFLALYCKDYFNKCQHISILWIICAVAFVGLQAYRIINYNPSLSYTANRDAFYELFCPLVFLYLLSAFRAERIKVAWFEHHTFTIYAAHYLVVSIMASSFFCSLIHFPGGGGYDLLVIIVEPVVIYLGLLFAGMVLSMYCPKIYKLLSGGR